MQVLFLVLNVRSYYGSQYDQQHNGGSRNVDDLERSSYQVKLSLLGIHEVMVRNHSTSLCYIPLAAVITYSKVGRLDAIFFG